MSWNNRNNPKNVKRNNERKTYKLRLAWAWINLAHPTIADVINDECVRAFPIPSSNKVNAGRGFNEDTVKTLKSLKIA